MKADKVIFFDGEGFDNNYQAYMPAIDQFLKENLDYQIYLYVLDATIIQIKSHYSLNNLVYKVCTNYIKPNDNPLAFRNNPDATMIKLIKDSVNNPEKICPIILSAGNSGAFILAVSIYLKKINPNVALGFMSIFPTADNSPKVMLDLGSNLNPTTKTLLSYARQAQLFNEIYFNFHHSKLYLLNNGQEAWKGLKLHQDMYKILKESKEFNFCGNLESKGILNSDANIILADGWSANIALKAIEGTADFVLDKIKETIKAGSLIEKIAGKIIKKPIKKIFNKYNYQQAGGAFILGIERICIKLHGSSDTMAFYHSLNRAKTAIEKELLEKMAHHVN